MQAIFEELLNPKVQEFIIAHTGEDERALVLRNNTILGIPAAAIAGQISARRKAKEKIPSFFNSAGILYPAGINLEQASSEIAAKWKASFLKTALGDITTGADLTGGFGVDSFFLSVACSAFDYVEANEVLVEIARHNHQLLGSENIAYHHSNAEEFVENTSQQFDFIFIDPSRRKDAQKVFRLKDCQPDLTALQTIISKKSASMLVKTSPLLDLKQGVEELSNVEHIIVLAINNECKEILFFCRHTSILEPLIHCVNLDGLGVSKSEMTFRFSDEKSATSVFSDPRAYVYEPNAAILKGGAFKYLGARMGLAKLHQHTHLYTSEKLISDFPGRVFGVDVINPTTKNLLQYFPEMKANVISRNYPLTPDAIKKKLKLSDGGEKFLICFSGVEKKFMVVARRIA